jgi:hypothetical protein
MNVYELTEKLGGEIVRGKARFRKGSDYIVIGFVNGDDMIFTEEGRQIAAEYNNEPKTKRGRPAKSDVVESEQAAPVDDVLAEIEAAVAAAEQVVEDVPFPISEPASQTGLT